MFLCWKLEARSWKLESTLSSTHVVNCKLVNLKKIKNSKVAHPTNLFFKALLKSKVASMHVCIVKVHYTHTHLPCRNVPSYHHRNKQFKFVVL